MRQVLHPLVLHPLPIRIMHWINAVTMVIMIGSGWKIYNDEVIFGWLHFPEAVTIGKWAQHGLQWHFFGMWILALNGICYLTYGLVTSRFRRMLLPLRFSELIATVKDALRFHLSHDDPTRYNAVQKLLYIGVILLGVMIVISGLAIWKPIQFSELLALFGSFQTARLVHFLCMTGIVAFMIVHVTLALLVPHTLVAMFTGGPMLDQSQPASEAAPVSAPSPSPAPQAVAPQPTGAEPQPVEAAVSAPSSSTAPQAVAPQATEAQPRPAGAAHEAEPTVAAAATEPNPNLLIESGRTP
jgi:thiosulfate reductase cytochrome b subunit